MSVVRLSVCRPGGVVGSLHSPAKRLFSIPRIEVNVRRCSGGHLNYSHFVEQRQVSKISTLNSWSVSETIVVRSNSFCRMRYQKQPWAARDRDERGCLPAVLCRGALRKFRVPGQLWAAPYEHAGVFGVASSVRRLHRRLHQIPPPPEQRFSAKGDATIKRCVVGKVSTR